MSTTTKKRRKPHGLTVDEELRVEEALHSAGKRVRAALPDGWDYIALGYMEDGSALPVIAWTGGKRAHLIKQLRLIADQFEEHR